MNTAATLSNTENEELQKSGIRPVIRPSFAGHMVSLDFGCKEGDFAKTLDWCNMEKLKSGCWANTPQVSITSIHLRYQFRKEESFISCCTHYAGASITDDNIMGRPNVVMDGATLTTLWRLHTADVSPSHGMDTQILPVGAVGKQPSTTIITKGSVMFSFIIHFDAPAGFIFHVSGN